MRVAPERGESLHEAARTGGADAESFDQGLRQLGGVAQGPHPAVGHLHTVLLDHLGRSGGAQPIGADVEVQQPAARPSGEGPPHGRADIDVGRAVADLTAVEPGGQEVEAGQHPVAGGEALGAQAIPVGREDGVAHTHGSGMEVTGGGNIRQGQQRTGDHDRMRGEAVEETGLVDQAGGGERGGQIQGQAAIGESRTMREGAHTGECIERHRHDSALVNRLYRGCRPVPSRGG